MAKFIRTDFTHDIIQNGSSYKVYVCKDSETANFLHHAMMTASPNVKGAYWTVSTVRNADCRVPEFFKDSNYYFTIVEHNNGNWDEKATYELFLVS